MSQFFLQTFLNEIALPKNISQRLCFKIYLNTFTKKSLDWLSGVLRTIMFFQQLWKPWKTDHVHFETSRAVGNRWYASPPTTHLPHLLLHGIEAPYSNDPKDGSNSHHARCDGSQREVFSCRLHLSACYIRALVGWQKWQIYTNINIIYVSKRNLEKKIYLCITCLRTQRRMSSCCGRNEKSA